MLMQYLAEHTLLIAEETPVGTAVVAIKKEWHNDCTQFFRLLVFTLDVYAFSIRYKQLSIFKGILGVSRQQGIQKHLVETSRVMAANQTQRLDQYHEDETGPLLHVACPALLATGTIRQLHLHLHPRLPVSVLSLEDNEVSC